MGTGPGLEPVLGFCESPSLSSLGDAGDSGSDSEANGQMVRGKEVRVSYPASTERQRSPLHMCPGGWFVLFSQ